MMGYCANNDTVTFASEGIISQSCYTAEKTAAARKRNHGCVWLE